MKPFNAEAPLDVLRASTVTPNESFFVRNHLPVPKVNEAAYELEITGEGLEENTLTLENLKRFPKHSGNFLRIFHSCCAATEEVYILFSIAFNGHVVSNN